jgi:flagellar biosynthesis protein FlhG
MSDQAEVLRQAAQRGRNREPLRRLSQRKSDDTARVVAVTSGKGGVGKTSFVVNLAVVLADLGMRVTILDADLGLANVDVLLGLAARHNLHHVINGTLSLEDILIKGPRDVQIIPGASGLRDIADMGLEDRKYLVESLYKTTRGRDLVIVDTAAGMSRNVLDFVLSAQEIIVLTAPEPAAMTDAYAMIKVISRENPNSVVRLVVNMCPNRTEAENVVEQLTLLSDRFLDFSFDALGYIPPKPPALVSLSAPKSHNAPLASTPTGGQTAPTAPTSVTASAWGYESPAETQGTVLDIDTLNALIEEFTGAIARAEAAKSAHPAFIDHLNHILASLVAYRDALVANNADPAKPGGWGDY